MNVLKRLLGLLLGLILFGPWIAIWSILGLLLWIIRGDKGIDFAWDMIGWPYERWIRPLMLAGSNDE